MQNERAPFVMERARLQTALPLAES